MHTNNTRNLYSCVFVFIRGLIMLACAARAERFEAAEPHMGTVARITVYARDASAIPAAFARIHDLDEKLSDYKPDSELNRVCRTAHDRPVHVSEDLFRVLEASQNLAKITSGAFDVTIGPVTHLWRIGKTPDAATLARCGYRNLILDRKNRTVSLKVAQMQLDLGAIAKGYAADEAIATLRARGVTRALVAISGDIVAGDPPPDKKGWTIEVDSTGGHLTLANAAVSTSGDSEQHLVRDGVRYSHIIDPKTGLGLTNPITVTVIARRGIDADPLATAISVLGEPRGRALLGSRARRIIISSAATEPQSPRH
jgi:FAD:protein FMN transferase